MNIHDYRKIVIFGSSGAGKSYLSRRIAELTGYPSYHLDAELLKPGWIMLEHNESVARQNEIISGNKWIIEGNYKKTMELRYVAADLVIFIDVGRFRRIVSVLRRRGQKRPELPDYFKDYRLFSKENVEFLKIVWSHDKATRKAVFSMREKYPNTPFLHVKGRREVNKWLREWGE